MIHLDRLYDEINADYFEGKLPRIVVEWSDVLPENALAGAHAHGISPCYQKYCGSDCTSSFIRIHPILKFMEFETIVESSLIHEMAHIKSLLGDKRLARHTPAFRAELRRLMLAGAYDHIL